MICIVCENSACVPFGEFDHLLYWRCPRCQSTFLEPEQQPAPDVEVAQYELHENDPHDKNYRAFLDRLAAPLLERIPCAANGLDYGCGPGPALAVMLREAGHTVALYDPFFQPHPEVLHQSYDFVTCTEAVEHFHYPAREFRQINSLLKPGGWLGIMTTFQTDDSRFAKWHYRRDPTHVAFYREETFRQLARDYGWHWEVPRPNVVLFQKPQVASC